MKEINVIKVTEEDIHIELPETTNFRCIERCFRQIKTAILLNKNKNVILDFRRTIYIDSSGLGMLLMLRDLNKFNRITLCNVEGEVKKSINISNFNKLFDIK